MKTHGWYYLFTAFGALSLVLLVALLFSLQADKPAPVPLRRLLRRGASSLGLCNLTFLAD